MHHITSVQVDAWRRSSVAHHLHQNSCCACAKISRSRWVQTSRLVAHAHFWEPSRWAELGLSWHIHTRTLMNTPGILWLQWLLPASFLYRLTTCIHSYIDWTTISSGGPCMFASLASSISSHLLFLEEPFSRATQILTAGMYPLSGYFKSQYFNPLAFLHWPEKALC